MKKLLLLKMMLLLCALVVGSGTMWADTVTLTQSSLGLTGSYTTNTEKTIGDITYVYTDLMKNSNNIQAKASSGTIYNKTAFPGNISSVAITHSGTGRATTIFGSSDGTNWTQVQTGSGSITGDFSGRGYKYFKITRGSNAAYWTQIVITYSAPACATPTFSPAAGIYSSAQTVTISTETEGATIYYTTDGTVPSSSNGTAYSSPISVSSTQTIKAIAVKDGNSDSEVATAAYTITSAVATTTTIDASGITNTDVYVDTAAGSLSASVTPAGSSALSNPAIAWNSSNESVATIASDGTVTLVAAGTTTITASYAGVTDTYQASSDTYDLTVTSSAPYVQPTSVTFNMNYEWLGSSNGGNLVSGDLPVVKSQDNVTVTITDGTNTRPRGDGDYIRVYNGSTITFAAPSGYDITSIAFTAGGTGTWNAPTPDSGTLSEKTWSGSASSVVFTLSGSCFISTAAVTLTVQKDESNLTLTSSSAVALEKTSANVSPTSTITWTTSSEGEMTFTTSDGSVATVSAAGVITAVGAGLATITFSQAADENYKASTDKTVTVTVTDSRSACATGIDLPAAQKTLAVGDMDDFAATATIDTGFTGSVTYTYATSDATVLEVADNTFSAEAPGTATITITATPTGGNAANYKTATQDVVVTVKGTTSLTLSTASVTPTYPATATVNATVAEGYDGTLTVSSNIAAVATATVEGTTITITPAAVGTATITVTAPATSVFNGSVEQTINVIVGAPAGSTEAPISEVTTTFTDKNLNHNDGGLDWTATIEANSFESSNSARGVQFGAAQGEFTLNLTNTKRVKKVSFVMSTNGSGNTIAVQVGSTDFENNDAASVTLTNGMSNETLEFTGEATGNIVVSCNDVNKSIYFKSITVEYDATASITLPVSGIGTYCCQYPLDFSDDTNYKAYIVKNVDSPNITLEKITGSITGGVPFIIKGEASATVNVPMTDCSDETVGNLLTGTLAPTYVLQSPTTGYTNFGMSSGKFKKLSKDGVIPANKAYLTIADGVVNNAHELHFIFSDEEVTGINSLKDEKSAMGNDNVYDLQGRKVQNPKPGLYIINGKKVVIK